MRIFLIASVVLICSTVFGQTKDSLSTLEAKPIHFVGLSPLNLLNRFPTVFLHYETHLSDNWNVNIGGGVVIDLQEDENNQQQDFVDKRGFKINSELKYYFSSAGSGLFYISAVAEYFNIKFDRARTFGFNCDNGFGCAYFQYDQYEVTRQHFRLGGKAGYTTTLGDGVMLDLGLGLIMDVRDYSNSGRIDNFDIQYGDTDLREEGRTSNLLPVPHFRIGYLIK